MTCYTFSSVFDVFVMLARQSVCSASTPRCLGDNE